MDLEQVDPCLRAVVRRTPRPNVSRRLVRRLVGAADLLQRTPKVPGVVIEGVRNRTARYRLYLPEQRRGAAMVWMHGGGMIMGTPRQTDRLCAETALQLGVVIASVDYRLAPQHPFPAALDDCHDVWIQVQTRAREWGVDPGRVAIGGQSAGGGLAASLGQRLLDEGGVQPVAQWLIYPMLDDRTAGRTELDAVDHWIWNNRSNRFGWRSLLCQEPGAAAVPAYAVPARRTDLRGLPPTWIGVGSIDLFHDEDVAYAQRLRRAGVDATLDVVPGAPHSFVVFAPDTDLSRGFLSRARAWLGPQLAGGSLPARD